MRIDFVGVDLVRIDLVGAPQIDLRKFPLASEVATYEVTLT